MMPPNIGPDRRAPITRNNARIALAARVRGTAAKPHRPTSSLLRDNLALTGGIEPPRGPSLMQGKTAQFL